MSAKFARFSLVILMITHFCLAAWFAMITPYRTGGILLSQRGPDGKPAYSKDIGAPDERQHANYIGYLLKEGKLPVFDPKSSKLYEEYQSHQPGLYYAGGFLVSKITGQTDPETQGFGRALRLANCLIACFAIAGTFSFAFWLTRRSEIALVAASVHALLPMIIALSSAISNDPLLIALVTWSLALMAKSREHPGALLLAGMLAGFACCTKSSGLIALVILIGVVVVALRASGEMKRFALLALGMAVLIPIPIWIRNLLVYGDPLAQSAFKEAFVGSAQKSAILGAIEAGPSAGSPEVQYWINWIGYWTARSFIGVFGYMDIWFNASGKANSNSDPNLLYKAIILFNFLGLGGGFLWLRNNWNEHKRLGAITLGLIGLTVALFVMFNNTYFQAQARYLFPALSAFATLMAIGWVQIFRKWQIALALVVLIFGGFTIYAGTQLPGEFAKRIQAESPSP